jgi:hypothetical protein
MMGEALVLPGQYSGDMWHVAGAMLFQPALRVVITVISSEDAEGAKGLVEYFTSIGLGDRTAVLRGKTAHEVTLGSDTYPVGDLPGKQLVWGHTGCVQATVAQGKNLIQPVYRSTRTIMRAMEMHGKAMTLLVLRAGLTTGLSKATCSRIAAYVAGLLKDLAGQKLLFVLGRIAGYNPQHDLDVPRLQQIAVAAASAGYTLACVGPAAKVTALAVKAGVKLARCVDLRDWETLTGSKVPDERARAYFWRCLLDFAPTFKITLKLVGGRSGSTDLAAFMGVEVLCWDVCDVFNPEYLRLLMTSPDLLLVTHTDVELGRASLAVVPFPPPQFAADVASFLAGTFTPAKLRFAQSKNLAKKGGDGAIEEALDGLLTRLDHVAECVALHLKIRRARAGISVAIDDLSQHLIFRARSGDEGSDLLPLAPSFAPLTLLGSPASSSSSAAAAAAASPMALALAPRPVASTSAAAAAAAAAAASASPPLLSPAPAPASSTQTPPPPPPLS